MCLNRCAVALRCGCVLAMLALMAGCHSVHEVGPAVERVDLGGAVGPEDLAVDEAGGIVTGVEDGRILRVGVDGVVTEIGHSGASGGGGGGRPQGIAVGAGPGAGQIVVADARRGLLMIDSGGEVRVLVGKGGPLGLNFPNGVAVGGDGRIYFTDSSRRYDIAEMPLAALTADATGRLIEFNPATGQTRVLLDDLVFANGVALSPDGTQVYVAETFAYRIRRYFLSGPRPRTGESEILRDDLPGFPDNLHVDERGRLWVALYSERVRSLELIQQVGFLPRLLSPALRPAVGLMGGDPPRVSRVVVIDVVEDPGDLLRVYELGRGPQAYGPLTSAVVHEGRLYLGSSRERSIGVVELD